MKLTGRMGMVLGGAVLLAAALGYAFAPRPVAVDVARVQSGPLCVTIDEDGRTRIRERYVVSAPLGGQLRRIMLEPGDAVQAGKTLIALIEPTAPDLLDARTRAQLEARLRAAEAQVAHSVPRAERVRAAQQLAELDLQRAQTLAERAAISRQELDRAREAARATAEDLRSAEYARQIATFEGEQAQAALLRSAPAAAASDCAWEMRVLAPIDGCVLRLFHEDAAVVPAAERLIELGDPRDLEVEVDVLSNDAVKIRPGARVAFEHWGGDAPLEGRVRRVEPAGFLKISALGVEEQRVNVIADFVTSPAERRTLGDAYRVEARIVIWEAENVLKVPVGALFRSEGHWAVFTAQNGRARLTVVDAGHSDGRETEIRGGLTAGDSVVLHPSDKIADGVRITAR